MIEKIYLANAYAYFLILYVVHWPGVIFSIDQEYSRLTLSLTISAHLLEGYHVVMGRDVETEF